ncbi:MAG: helix-turn-helix domain-containing protein [Agathobacter sp.]
MHKAIFAKAQDDFKIKVAFSDGKVVLYDVKPLFSLIPPFRNLQAEPELFKSVKVDADGTMVFWNDSLALDAKEIWANGTLIEYTKKPSVNRILAYRIQLARLALGMTQKELSEKTGICQADISKLERGMGNPSIATLTRLAEGLDMELSVDLHPLPVKEAEKTKVTERKMNEEKDMIQNFRHKTLEERAAAYDGQLNLAGEYDRGEPVGREVW